MRCSQCNAVLIGAILVGEDELCCSSCDHVLKLSHETKFENIVDKSQGYCPYCQEFNEKFKSIKNGERLVCYHCGLSFRIRKSLSNKLHDGAVCPKCGIQINRFFITNENLCLCPQCQNQFKLPLNIDIPRIALTNSGTCPFCLDSIFHFEKKSRVLKCSKCATKFEILLSPELSLEYFVKLAHGYLSENVDSNRSSNSAVEEKEFSIYSISPEILDKTKKLLIRTLGKSKFISDLESVIGVELINFLNINLMVFERENTPDDEKKIWMQVFTLGGMALKAIGHNELTMLTFIQQGIHKIANAALKIGINSLAVVCYAFANALKICMKNHDSGDVSLGVTITCPDCTFSFQSRYYRVIRHDSKFINNLEEVNLIVCPMCNFTSRIPNSIAVVNLTEKTIIAYFDSNDSAQYFANQSIGWLSKYFASFSLDENVFSYKIVDDIDDFFRQLTTKQESEMQKVRIYAPGIGNILGVLRQLGASCHDHSLYELSAKSYELAIKIDPNGPENYQGLASAYNSLNRKKEALEMLSKAHSITDDEAGYVQMPIPTKSMEEIPKKFSQKIKIPPPILEKVKEEVYRTTIDYLQVYLEKYPDDQQMCFFAASIFHKLGMKNNTIQACLKTISIQPEYSEISRCARLMLSMFNKTQFVEYLEWQLLR